MDLSIYQTIYILYYITEYKCNDVESSTDDEAIHKSPIKPVKQEKVEKKEPISTVTPSENRSMNIINTTPSIVPYTDTPSQLPYWKPPGMLSVGT